MKTAKKRRITINYSTGDVKYLKTVQDGGRVFHGGFLGGPATAGSVSLVPTVL